MESQADESNNDEHVILSSEILLCPSCSTPIHPCSRGFQQDFFEIHGAFREEGGHEMDAIGLSG
jgi:hypothetical protein